MNGISLRRTLLFAGKARHLSTARFSRGVGQDTALSISARSEHLVGRPSLQLSHATFPLTPAFQCVYFCPSGKEAKLSCEEWNGLITYKPPGVVNETELPTSSGNYIVR